MRNRASPALLVPVLAVLACGGDSLQDKAAPDEVAVIRTADPFKRGYTEADFPRVQQLADGVYSYEQMRAGGEVRMTTVSLFVVTSEGVLVVDGQGNVTETQRLIDTIKGITDQPITHVVIGSDHGDHTSGNSAFPADAVFLAHPTSAAVLEASANQPNRAPDAPPVRLATQLVEDKAVLHLGGKEIQLLFLGRAHTGGDLVAYLPAEKILFMSEVFFNRSFPSMRTAYPTEWVETLEKAKGLDVDLYVPGHGFVDSPEILREELDTFQQAIRTAITSVKQVHDTGVDVEAAVEQVRFGDLEDWSNRGTQGPVAVRRIYMELGGELR